MRAGFLWLGVFQQGGHPCRRPGTSTPASIHASERLSRFSSPLPSRAARGRCNLDWVVQHYPPRRNQCDATGRVHLTDVAETALPINVVAWHGAMPRSYQLVGWREPMLLDAPRMFSSWPDGTAILHQRIWDAHDPQMTQAYLSSQLAPPDKTVLVQGDGWTVTRDARSLDSESCLRPIRWNCSTSYPCWNLLASPNHDGLFRWLGTRPLITSMHLRAAGSDTRSARNASAVSCWMSPASKMCGSAVLSNLTIIGACDSSLVISSECNGCNLTVCVEDRHSSGQGFPNWEDWSFGRWSASILIAWLRGFLG